MTCCTWQMRDGGPLCGRPADAFRVRFVATGVSRQYYCKQHLAAIRARTSDKAARDYWGVETMPVTA